MHTGLRHHRGHSLAWFYNLLGWGGVVCIVSAYFLVSFNYLEPSSFPYQALNILGSLGIIASSLPKKDYQPVALNLVWLVIALISLLRPA